MSAEIPVERLILNIMTQEQFKEIDPESIHNELCLVEGEPITIDLTGAATSDPIIPTAVTQEWVLQQIKLAIDNMKNSAT